MDPPVVVFDCGTGYTKMGFSGNVQPSYVIPTVIGTSKVKTAKHNDLADLDFCIGHEAVANAATCNLTYPVRHGLIDSWDHMEKFWTQSIHQYLQIDPEGHQFILTEPPMSPPEAREYTAEVMFETFNVSGLFIGVQAVLAMYASFAAAERRSQTAGSLTGTVIDAGDGVTHVIPVVDGYVIGSGIKTVPLAGKDVTLFVQQLMRERGEPVPPDMSLDVARQVKEAHCYTCGDMAKEFLKHEQQPDKYLRQYQGVNPKTGKAFTADVGYERFLGPEMFFTPEIYSPSFSTPLPEVVDAVVQSCPIDTRRALYSNIILSGGSTMFKDFGRRLERDIRGVANRRLTEEAKTIEVNVMQHHLQRYAVWFGGSVLATTAEFPKACHSRADYLEHGPSICRTNYVFREA